MATVHSVHQIRGIGVKIPPKPSATRTLHPMGPRDSTQGTAVYVWADALAELIHAASRRSTVMQAAILVGGLYAGPGERFVEIRGYMHLERHDDTLDFARNIHESWTALTNRVSRRGENLRIVGWACLRASDEALPRDLQMAHRSFFNLPYQMTLTIDPVSEQIALYGFDEVGRLVQIGFQLVVDQS